MADTVLLEMTKRKEIRMKNTRTNETLPTKMKGGERDERARN